MKSKFYILFAFILLIVSIISILEIDIVEHIDIIFYCYLIRTIGNTVIGHRYFAHKQFEVGKFFRKLFAYYVSLSGFSTALYWSIQHTHHHRYSDKINDIHSPKQGILNSFILWFFKSDLIDSVLRDRSSLILIKKLKEEKSLIISHNYFILLNLTLYIILYNVNETIFYCWAVSYLLEIIKLGLVNTYLHINELPGNYKNHVTNDNSNNNIIIGYLTLGFGWHNNHHSDSKKLSLTEKWWEVDVESYIAALLSKICRI